MTTTSLWAFGQNGHCLHSMAKPPTLWLQPEGQAAMIHNVDFDLSPIAPGETRAIIVVGSGQITYEISCFVRDPPPAGYKPCNECNTVRAASGEPVMLTASAKRFAKGGTLEVIATDSAGDQRKISIDVSSRSRGSSYASAQS